MRIVKRAALLLLALTLLGAGSACAAGYSVRPVPPECQADQEAWYYDFTVEPGQELVLQAVIMNINSEEIQVAVEANTASTNSNGLIEFTKTEQRDPSMAVDFGEICVPIEPVVTVPAMSEAVAEFALTVPEEPFDGILYGGFLFTMQGQDAQAGDGAMGIANVFRYAVGARIRENPKDAEPEFELLNAELDNSDMPALVLNFRNPAPALARGIGLSIALYKNGSEEADITFERNGIEMAPNTLMPYRIELMDAPPEAGEYRVEAKLRFGEREWTFETPLKVE